MPLPFLSTGIPGLFNVKNIVIFVLVIACGVLFMRTLSLKNTILERERDLLASVTLVEEQKTVIGQLEFDLGKIQTALNLERANLDTVKAALKGSQDQVTKLSKDSDYWYHRAKKLDTTLAKAKEVSAAPVIKEAKVLDVPSSTAVIAEFNSVITDVNNKAVAPVTSKILPKTETDLTTVAVAVVPAVDVRPMNTTPANVISMNAYVETASSPSKDSIGNLSPDSKQGPRLFSPLKYAKPKVIPKEMPRSVMDSLDDETHSSGGIQVVYSKSNRVLLTNIQKSADNWRHAA